MRNYGARRWPKRSGGFQPPIPDYRLLDDDTNCATMEPDWILKAVVVVDLDLFCGFEYTPDVLEL